MKRLFYSLIIGALVSTLALGAEVRKLGEYDLSWGPFGTTWTSPAGKVVRYLPRYFDNNAFADNLALYGKSLTGDGSGSITGFNIPLYLTQYLSLYDALTYQKNVKAYGAVGDGVTDDITAFTDALAELSTTDGGILFIPKGTYYLSNRLSIPSNVIVLGSGIDVTVLHNTGAPGYTGIGIDARGVLGSNYPIDNSIEQSNTVTTTTHSNAGNFSAGDNVMISMADDGFGDYIATFITTVVSANAGSGVITLTERVPRSNLILIHKITTLIKNVSVRDLTIEDADIGVVYKYARDMEITRVKFSSTNTYGLNIVGVKSSSVNECIFDYEAMEIYGSIGGKIESNAFSGGAGLNTVAIGFSGGSEGNIAHGNTMTDASTFTVSIYVTQYSQRNIIYANKIYNLGNSVGIQIAGFSSSSGQNIVSSNIIGGNTSGGIGISYGGNTDNNIIYGNNIWNVNIGVLNGSGTNNGNFTYGNVMSGVATPYSYSGSSYNNGFVFSGKIKLDRFIFFADADATPSVAAGSAFYANNATPTTITGFDDGVAGQQITVFVITDNTTFDFSGSNLKGNGGADLVAQSGDSLFCIETGGWGWACQVSKIH